MRLFRDYNKAQLERLSEIAGNLSLLFFATIVIPIVIGEKTIDTVLIIIGLSLTIFSLFASIWLIRNKRK